jgi:hypothetical protein
MRVWIAVTVMLSMVACGRSPETDATTDQAPTSATAEVSTSASTEPPVSEEPQSSMQAAVAQPSCDKPPYGSTDQAYTAFAQNLGMYVVPTDYLSKICKVKYERADRKALYNIGFTDQKIDGEDTVQLGIDMMEATKAWVDKTCAGKPNCP